MQKFLQMAIPNNSTSAITVNVTSRLFLREIFNYYLHTRKEVLN